MGDRRCVLEVERGARDDEPHLRIVARRQCADAEQVLRSTSFFRSHVRDVAACAAKRQPGKPPSPSPVSRHFRERHEQRLSRRCAVCL